MSAEPATENPSRSAIRTFLFTDIEGSTRLWEHEPARMRVAVARHDALSREAVESSGGRVVKTTGDGVHAVFDDALQALRAALRLQQAMAAPPDDGALALKVRCGVHSGDSEARDGDYFGPALNRAARVMGAAHGGQTLVTQVVAERVAGHLPPQTTLLDLGTVRLRDLASPERVYQLQHPSLREQFPPLRSLEATPNNLVQQLNSFVGRERELAEVRALLGKSRLLTLLGMGGIGKSRLSVQLGAELLDEYPDGVWLVELAPLADPRGVPQALATVLGVREEAGLGVVDALLAYVRDKQLLVILDNCEHVVQACAELAKRLLQASPGVRVLTSSRDVLQVTGETVYQVPTLGVPAASEEDADTVPPQRGGSAPTASKAPLAVRPGHLIEIGRHAAVQLFLDRVGAVQPSFRLDGGNAAAVASICRRLDGIPLALELAAARTRALSVQAIAERLKDRFRLLVSGDSTVLPRQRTLRALIDWSFDLLDESERRLFRRLAIFAGGWTLESAEAVCAGGGLESPDVLDLLARLVEKSLVTMEAGGERYRMLETVRAYALEKLAEAGEEASTRDRHLAHFLGLAEVARPHLAGPVQGLWLKRLDPERENFVAGFGFSEKVEDDHNFGVRIMHALRPYFITRGDLSTGLRLATDVLQRPGTARRDAWRCMALFGAGQFCFYLDRQSEAQRYLLECVAIARETGSEAILARSLQPLGAAELAAGDLDAARSHLDEAVELARQLGEPREIASATNSLALLHRMQGRFEDADLLFQEVAALARSVGDQESTAMGLLNLSMTRVSAGRIEVVLPLLREVVTLAREVESQPVWQSLADVCAGLASVLGKWDAAAFFFGAAESQSADARRPRYIADRAFLDPLMGRVRHALVGEAFAEAEAVGRSAPVAEFKLRVEAWILEARAS